MILQNVVSVTADDDTGTLFSQLQDNITLDIPEEISSGQTVHDTGNALRGEGIGEQAAAGRVLTMFFHILRGEAGFQSNLVNQFFVIEGNTKFLCDHMTKRAATAAKFAADGDDCLFHVSYLLIVKSGDFINPL